MGISHFLLYDPHFIQGTHPLPLLRPLIHQGQRPGVGRALFGREGSGGTCSSSISGSLQPIICGNEGLRVLETSYQALVAEPDGTQDIFQDRDSAVGSSFSSVSRLIGVSGLEGCVLASSVFIRIVANTLGS